MNIKLENLILNCKKSREVIDLSHHISIFYGKISSGKSSIARLIDYCLGGDLEKTPAIQSELVSVMLAATIGNYSVVFERILTIGSTIRVTWTGPNNNNGSINVPKQAGNSPIWGNNIYSLSDLIFFFLDLTPPKVRKSKLDPDSPLIRLGFRDFLEFCYLEQDKLDSTFYNLDVPILKEKSKDVLRFIVGYYSEKLNDLEIELEKIRQQRYGMIEAKKQVVDFLQKLGYGSELEIAQKIEDTNKELKIALQAQLDIKKQYIYDTHPSDDLREKIRTLGDKIEFEKLALVDIQEKIEEQESLRSELLSTKIKISRTTTASQLLSGVSFIKCPVCGSKLENPTTDDIANNCYLCHASINTLPKSDISEHAEQINNDLSSRIDDLSISVKNLHASEIRQNIKITKMVEIKKDLDNDLSNMLRNYESAYLSTAKNIEREIATLQERQTSLVQLYKLPKELHSYDEKVTKLQISEEEIKNTILSERKMLYQANQNISLLEDYYLNSLLEVAVPGVNSNDKVDIDIKNWIPNILTDGDLEKAWNFYNAGSGGKKTLLNVLFAVAFHKLSIEKQLPLPNILIIDTPMKNIGKEINKDLFRGFYDYLYLLAINSLKNTQIIIIDSDYFPPEDKSIDIFVRYMTPLDSKFPPLITYYQGS